MDSDFDFEDEFDYNGDHFNSDFRAPRIPARWQFLRDFIEIVGDRYMPQTPCRLHSNDGSVRLGRDPSDWWINVQFENGALVSKYDQLADDRVARYRTVREATLLLGVLARVDYIAFLALLVRRGKFDVPKYMNLDTHALPRQFNFFFCRDLEAKEYALARLQDVLGDRSYSQEFLEHLNTIDTMAHTTHEGEEESKTDDQRTASPMWHLLLVPLSVKLTFRPDETSVRNQVIILKNITKIVREMQQIEENRLRSGHTDSSGRIVPPVFYLECIHLDLREFTLGPKVLKALETLIRTGVPISSLTLPFNVSADDEGSEDLLAVQLAWASFVVVILGAHP